MNRAELRAIGEAAISAAFNEAITETVGPGLSENRRKLTPEQHAEMFGPDCPPPGDDIDELVADIRRVEMENSNNPRRL